ncbi:MAG: PIN domain-containing protein [Oscillospiraceae bacterium]|nr:PIN domain-containing protein [Oscillospiraceae bacterium]
MKNTLIVDANVILRLILNDNKEMVQKSKNVIRTYNIVIKNEVLAEVVYVLQKVYKVTKLEICDILLKFIAIDEIEAESKEFLNCALTVFKNNNIDFVDCLLYAYNKIEGNKVFTFDKALNKLLESNS